MKRYYIIWDEKRNCSQYTCGTFLYTHNKKEAKDIVLIEQNYRRIKGLPHMFHVYIGMNTLNETFMYKRLYTQKDNCDQEQINKIKEFLIGTGAIERRERDVLFSCYGYKR